MLVEYKNTPKEYNDILAFLEKEGQSNKNQMWDPGRMNFWRSSAHGNKDDNDPFFTENVCTWVENDEIVALAISEYGKKDIFIEVSSKHPALYKEVFDWILKVWSKDKTNIKIICFEDDYRFKDILERNNFTFCRHFENKRFYDLKTQDFDYKLPQGYRISTFLDNPDYDSRVNLVRSAFNNTSYSATNIKKIHDSKDYIRDLDLEVISPDGTYVAYCCGWRWPGKDTFGYIEPVGTHADYRQKGLASAVIKEAFKRLHGMGIDTVIISSHAEPAVANFLYDSLKPTYKRKVLEYEYTLF